MSKICELTGKGSIKGSHIWRSGKAKKKGARIDGVVIGTLAGVAKSGAPLGDYVENPTGAPPLEKDQSTQENSFAVIQQLTEFRRQRLGAAECVDQYGRIEMNHSGRVRRPPVRA